MELLIILIAKEVLHSLANIIYNNTQSRYINDQKLTMLKKSSIDKDEEQVVDTKNGNCKCKER